MRFGLIPKLLIGIIIGVLIGLYAPTAILRIMTTIGYILGQYIKFVIPLLIIAFISVGIANFGKKAGLILGVTLALAYISTLVAELLGYSIATAVLPWMKVPMGAAATATKIEPYLKIDAPQIMGIMSALLLAIILGIGITWLPRKGLFELLEDFRDIVTRLLRTGVIPVLPYFIATVFSDLAAKGQLVPTAQVFAKMLVLIVLVQWVWLLILYGAAGAYANQNPIPVMRAMLPAYLTAFGTMSSAATLPVAWDCAKTVPSLRKDIVDFCIPICNVAHLSGAAIAITISAMTVMMLTQGQAPTLGVFLPFMILLGIIEVAALGVPGGSVTAALGILQSTLGFNDAGLAMMIALFMIQDSFGTAANVTGDGAITMIVNKYMAGRKVDTPESQTAAKAMG